MLQGKELILATKPFAKEIRSKSWLYTLSTFFILSSLVLSALFIDNIWVKAFSGFFAGLVIIRAFIIFHDHQHHTILQKSALADILMTIFGIYILSPTSIWKRSHDYHHNNNSKLFSASIGSYPIATKKKFLEMSRAEQRTYLATRHPITILFGYITMFIYGMCISSFISSPKKHVDSLIALILHIAVSVIVFIYLGPASWFFGIFLPFFISLAIGAYLFYAQHNFPGVMFSENTEWKYEKAALESSSYMKMNRIMEWFTGNIGYHHIHHINSRIPFYRLPETMKHFPEFQNAKITSLKPKDIAACFKLKVWDAENKQMIGLDKVYQRA